MNTFYNLIEQTKQYNAGYLVLIDPDKLKSADIPAFLNACKAVHVDGILVGGSLLISGEFDKYVALIKSNAGDIPVFIFPGGLNQVSANADALLFLSLISGRDPQQLIGSQVIVAPLIYRLNIETIPTAYMLIESGKVTSAQFMSGTTPIPRNKPEIAIAHALAAQYLGFKLLYLEAGSGAEMSVPDEMIQGITSSVDIPVIVGGGIRTPEEARRKVAAGASFVVTGTIVENNGEYAKILKEFSEAIHTNGQK